MQRHGQQSRTPLCTPPIHLFISGPPPHPFSTCRVNLTVPTSQNMGAYRGRHPHPAHPLHNALLQPLNRQEVPAALPTPPLLTPRHSPPQPAPPHTKALTAPPNPSSHQGTHHTTPPHTEALTAPPHLAPPHTKTFTGSSPPLLTPRHSPARRHTVHVANTAPGLAAHARPMPTAVPGHRGPWAGHQRRWATASCRRRG